MINGQSDTSTYILQAMIAVAAADGEVRAREAETIRQVYARFTGETIREDAIKSTPIAARDMSTAFPSTLARTCHRLTTDAKEAILRAAYLVLIAEDRIGARAHKTLSDMVRALDISELHRSVIFEDVERSFDGVGRQSLH